MTDAADDRPRRIGVLADDLIWSTRLVDALRSAGADPVAFRSLEALEDRLHELDAAVVDLTARAYDGVDAVTRTRPSVRSVLAVGQHDDQALRRRALAAGADRVFAYRKLFEDGPATLARWLGAFTPSHR